METATLDIKKVAADLVADTQSLPVRNTETERAVVRKYSHILKRVDTEQVLAIAETLLKEHGFRWQAYELIQGHPGTFRRIGLEELETFGQGIDSWWSVDAFARTLSGPAWLNGQIPDEVITAWAHSPDLWWRRAALVSTVSLNMRSQGGKGDASRTLAVCRLLVADHEDMVVKAMSWALRELVVHDPQAVMNFLNEYSGVLAARAKREVRNKLTSGLKNPRKREQA